MILAVFQQTPLTVPSVTVPLASALVGGLMSYAVLKATVTQMKDDMHTLQKDVKKIHELLVDAITDIARIEGRMDTRRHTPPS